MSDDLVSLSAEDDLNEAQTLALLEERLDRSHLRIYSHIATFGTPLLQTASATQTLRCPSLLLDTVVAGLNKCMVVGESAQALGNEVPSSVNSYKWTVRTHIEVNVFSNATPTQFMGFGIGRFSAAPPWTSLVNPVLQVRQRIDDNKVELFSVPGDGSTSSTVVSTGTPDLSFGVKLEFTPGVSAVVTFRDGSPSMSITGASLADFNNSYLSWFNFFVTSGTNAAGQLSADFGATMVEATPIV